MLWSSRIADFPDDIEKTVVAFVFFVIKFVLASGATATDAKDVQESRCSRLVSVGIIGVSFSDGTAREVILPQEIGGIYQPISLEARPEWC